MLHELVLRRWVILAFISTHTHATHTRVHKFLRICMANMHECSAFCIHLSNWVKLFRRLCCFWKNDLRIIQYFTSLKMIIWSTINARAETIENIRTFSELDWYFNTVFNKMNFKISAILVAVVLMALNLNASVVSMERDELSKLCFKLFFFCQYFCFSTWIQLTNFIRSQFNINSIFSNIFLSSWANASREGSRRNCRRSSLTRIPRWWNARSRQCSALGWLVQRICRIAKM